MKLDIQFFASAPIEATIAKEYTRDEETKLVNEVKVIVTPTPNEAVTSEMLEGATVTLDGWTKSNDEQGSYYKTYAANKVETLTFKWTFNDGTYVYADVEVSVKEIGTFKYQKTNWVNDLTPVNADNMNNIEYGLEYISENGVGRGDSLPVGSIVEYDGDVIPDGYEKVNNKVVLYDNPSGSSETITLSDSATNYDYIVIDFMVVNNIATHIFQSINGKEISVSESILVPGENYVRNNQYRIDGNVLTLIYSVNYHLNGAGYHYDNDVAELKITRVTGYKEV